MSRDKMRGEVGDCVLRLCYCHRPPVTSVCAMLVDYHMMLSFTPFISAMSPYDIRL